MLRATLLLVSALGLIWLVAIGVLLVLGRTADARALAGAVPDAVRLLRELLADPRVPAGSKVLLWVAVIWCLSPIDLIPEFIPVIGPLDDVLIVVLVLRHLVRRTDRTVVAEHWHGDPRFLRFLVGGDAEDPFGR